MAPPLGWFWLGINVTLDIFLGLAMYVGLVVIIPRWERAALPRLDALKEKAAARRQVIAFHNALPLPNPIEYYPSFWIQMEKMYAVGLWISYAFTKIIVWFGVIGVGLVLILSKGNINPLSWNGLVYDLIYARANDQPNGAHIPSYFMLPLIALFVAYKFVPRNLGVLKVVGDIYQGVAVAGFLAAVHESIWEVWYYLFYYQFLTWNDLTNVLRDVSFTVWIAFMFFALVKYPNRTIPMKTFVYPILFYIAFTAAWAIVPYFFGYGFLPITTINNPSHSIGLYQETPYFSLWWVNVLEVGSWVSLGAAMMIAIGRLPQRIKVVTPEVRNY